MEIKKGKNIYKNLSIHPDSYAFYDMNTLQKMLRERHLTDNGLSGEQTKTERMIFDELSSNFSEYYFVEYIGGYPSQLVEISTVKVR